MIDLTPLDVRKKRGDFGKSLRGYDPPEVDGFLELVAERMEELVKENLAFREKIERLGEKVDLQEGREQAVQDALVTAQELRRDVKKQARREANLVEREARGRIEGMILESEKLLTEHQAALQELERQRERFLKAFRTFLERELDTVEVEFGRAPLEDVTLDLELGKVNWSIGEDEDDEEEEDDAGEVEDVSASESAEAPEVPVVADDPPAAASVSPEEGDGAAEAEEGRPPEGQEGGDSLWLSSIMSDREEKDAE
jgi:DivIVA domain-containing protein